ncbi:ABC transporter ATP-binding protein [Mastigocoleus testarum]|uniref:ABC transporter ATP-binding protein n=1 Tax=Mastigocoleus testarum BC008 TaxID=371196 RepID=A0A0V8A0A2_9CYAN|nr:ABC transporter ATP-binding protein [Mastigocoleus testarum]KST70031.1 ABC transporter ATP-binding protein [Mastigocoleus testarum BC008]
MLNNKLLFRFARPYPGLIILTLFLGFFGAFFNGIGTTLIVPIVLKIVGQDIEITNLPPLIRGIMTPFDSLPESYRGLVMGGIIIFTIFVKNLSNYTSVLASSRLTRLLTTDMRSEGVDLLLKIDMEYYTKMKIGDLINSLGVEISRAASTLGSTIRLVIISITILVFIGFLLSISWQLTIASSFLLSFVTLINQIAISRSRKLGTRLSEKSKAYSISVLEILNGIRLVKATANEDREYEKIHRLIREREQADFISQVYSQAIAPTSEFTGIVALVLIVFLGKFFFADSIDSISAVLLTYLLVLLRMLPFLSQLNSLRSNFANTSASINITSDFLNRDLKPFMPDGHHPYTDLKKGINFNSLSFTYPGHDKKVLEDINLYLPRGTTLALVGGSGAGKSTLADLLPRFYDPVSGSIEIDGVNLKEFELQSLRRIMGVVSQDTFLFNDSVRNNIAYGKQEATEEDIIHASKRANAYEFISKLPQGFDTMIGDRGIMLSGGQRQRLAIARALVQDPEILILDEATSALDTVSERLVQQAIDDLSRDRTTLVIAHRLSTVQKADKIAVLDRGRVVETGNHEELLEKNGYYSRLYSMQFGEGKEFSNKSSQSLIRLSYEIRTRLNSTIGFLGLLSDGMAENQQERQELIEESYKSVLRIFNTIDVLDDIVNLHTNLKAILAGNRYQKSNIKEQKLKDIADEFRKILNSILNSLHSLDNNLIDSPEEEKQIIIEVHRTTMHLLDKLERFEDTLNIR